MCQRGLTDNLGSHLGLWGMRGRAEPGDCQEPCPLSGPGRRHPVLAGELGGGEPHPLAGRGGRPHRAAGAVGHHRPRREEGAVVGRGRAGHGPLRRADLGDPPRLDDPQERHPDQRPDQGEGPDRGRGGLHRLRPAGLRATGGGAGLPRHRPRRRRRRRPPAAGGPGAPGLQARPHRRRLRRPHRPGRGRLVPEGRVDTDRPVRRAAPGAAVRPVRLVQRRVRPPGGAGEPGRRPAGLRHRPAEGRAAQQGPAAAAPRGAAGVSSLGRFGGRRPGGAGTGQRGAAGLQGPPGGDQGQRRGHRN